MAGGRLKGAVTALLALAAAAPAAAQDGFSDRAQGLANCAGAVAAFGGLDVLTYPGGASGEWAPLLGRILEALNREEGLEGMTGRYAASAARAYWAEQPRSVREAEANACRERFGRE